jgi:hypothetical protein
MDDLGPAAASRGGPGPRSLENRAEAYQRVLEAPHHEKIGYHCFLGGVARKK